MTHRPADLLPTIGVDPHRVTLFCLPHAGGGTSQFYRWQRLVPAWIQVAPLRLPGREDRLRETPYHQLPALVNDVVAAIRTAEPQRFVLLGHSMGSYVALEAARRLDAEPGLGPRALVIAGASAPQFATPRNRLAQLDDQTFISEIARRYDGLPDAVLADQRLLALVLPALRADIELVESFAYEASPALSCDMLAIGGLSDPGVPYERLAGWADHTSGQFMLRQFPGGHFFLHPEPLRSGGSSDVPPPIAAVVEFVGELFGETPD